MGHGNFDIIVKRVLVESGAENNVLCSNILKKIGNIPTEYVEPCFEDVSEGGFDMDKETLRLISFKGEFLKPCPGTNKYICCGYQILNVGTNCPMDCSYCILQAYFNKPSLRIFVNLEEKLDHIGRMIDQNPGRIFRVGTGEFTDSLALDYLTGWSDTLPLFFSKKKNAILELKTKTDCIEGIISSNVRDRIIVSWSLNSPNIMSREENGAPNLRKRLEAAQKCQKEGFVIGFHFDPLIVHQSWRDEYAKTIEMIDKYIDPKGIIWISMGCIRFMPGLKPVIRKRHPGTHILDNEFVPGLDGKMRYFKPIRMEMYNFMAEIFRKWHSDPGLYLCMESDEVWRESLGWSPRDSEGLSEYLDQRVRKFFN